LTFSELTYSLEDKVAILALNRPDKMNALSINLLGEIREAVESAPGQGARALILTGEGKAFSSGADLTGGEMPEDLGGYLRDHYEPALAALRDSDIPVISAINGPAVGAGMSIALQGDLTVMARSAYLLLAFANIGLVPDAGISWILTRSVGRARAMQMAMLAEKMPAQAALENGLVNFVVDDSELLAEATALATRLANGPSYALGCIRKQINAASELGFEDVLRIEATHQAACGRTADFKGAAIAFAEKRKPVFEGK
jgi:2-(1,2-epoxy-1,2-dihydrophenyl)acetyl-CoA isomerase